MAVAEPEREMVRAALPFLLPAVVGAFLLGWFLSGPGVAWSAAIGVAVVTLNFTVHGLSLARAARSGLVALAAVAAVGVVVRLAAIVALMAILNTFAFFSPRAFALAVVPATLLLLGYEMKVIASRSWSWWQLPEDRVPEAGPTG